MISFTCPSCLRPYGVPDASAGRTARCRCGQAIIVPGAVAAPGGAPAGLSVRMRRLAADGRDVGRALADFPLIRLCGAEGDPPESYEIEYLVRGLERGRDNQPRPRERHRVHIQFTSDYPRLAPKCRMLTPVFHPNIDPSVICIGDQWTAGERLVDLIVRIGQMIAYQDYNIKSPLDAEAAMWADLNAESLPIDGRNLHPPDAA